LPTDFFQLHEQGKTEQVKADLARLAKIKKEREEAQAKRKAETEGQSARIFFPPSLFDLS
jgi:hypothetical protein